MASMQKSLVTAGAWGGHGALGSAGHCAGFAPGVASGADSTGADRVVVLTDSERAAGIALWLP
jgi:hypothetical protein